MDNMAGLAGTPQRKAYPAKKIQIVLMFILRHKFIPTNSNKREYKH